MSSTVAKQWPPGSQHDITVNSDMLVIVMMTTFKGAKRHPDPEACFLSFRRREASRSAGGTQTQGQAQDLLRLVAEVARSERTRREPLSDPRSGSAHNTHAKAE
ncbi:hypothetical protein SKAU_G00051980 [Synaphobranchus kaupii]|uniref:Uncharacterized protein n=1 Tax=Synaphobranchus kaupii TaxID=118154 RepID=A0A9Q1G357_SYNKA|nr:hypothetical protein SKAU_G00051980 [Synaphobranchus kaupii]